MPRYEQQEEAKLTPEQRRIWDECKAGPRGSVPPPVQVWLKSPGLADHAHKLGAYVTARYWTAQFEWTAHVRLGLQAGLSQEQIDAIAERRTPEFDDPDDGLIYEFAYGYYQNHRVGDDIYERMCAHAGATRVSWILPGSSATTRSFL
jgi:4-carboxymuconolactone decarboxylase